MVLCVACGNLTRTTRFCSHFNAYLKEQELHKQMRCDGYKRKKP
jgi:hypothetical protein